MPINAGLWRREAFFMASAYSSPSRKCSRAIVAVCVIAFETLSSASRTGFGYGVERNASGPIFFP